jgi:hypothetical protein
VDGPSAEQFLHCRFGPRVRSTQRILPFPLSPLRPDAPAPAWGVLADGQQMLTSVSATARPLDRRRFGREPSNRWQVWDPAYPLRSRHHCFAHTPFEHVVGGLRRLALAPRRLPCFGDCRVAENTPCLLTQKRSNDFASHRISMTDGLASPNLNDYRWRDSGASSRQPLGIGFFVVAVAQG